MRKVLLAMVLALCADSSALANHIPGHSDSDPVFPIPIPGQEFFDGGALFVTAFGPLGGTEITNATFDITYVSDGVEAASDLYIHVSYSTPEFNIIEATVTGADLGFASGPGTFHAEFSTAALNGVVRESFLLPPYSQVDLEIGAIDGFIDGQAYFVDSFIFLDVVPEPAAGILLLVGAVCLRRR